MWISSSVILVHFSFTWLQTLHGCECNTCTGWNSVEISRSTQTRINIGKPIDVTRNCSLASSSSHESLTYHLILLSAMQCPDPHFKQKHRKRRIVQRTLVEALEKHLPTGGQVIYVHGLIFVLLGKKSPTHTYFDHFGQVFLQSDVEEVAKDMRDQFDSYPNFARVHLPGSVGCDSEGWLLESPLGVATEREIHAVANGGRIFRVLYQRVASSAS